MFLRVMYDVVQIEVFWSYSTFEVAVAVLAIGPERNHALDLLTPLTSRKSFF